MDTNNTEPKKQLCTPQNGATRFETVADMLLAIPKTWRKDAQLCIETITGNPVPIQRISLHRSNSGKKVIMLHRDTTSVG